MKINRLETHDRYQHFTKQKNLMNECVANIIKQRPFGDRPFYIFAHKREVGMDEKFSLMLSGQFSDLSQIPSARIIWQPRLTKPTAQTNSMLFKGYPGSDQVKVIWIIPERELWAQYKKGNMTESQIIVESIDKFENDRASLEAPEDDDASDSEIDHAYKDIKFDGLSRRRNDAVRQRKASKIETNEGSGAVGD